MLSCSCEYQTVVYIQQERTCMLNTPLFQGFGTLSIKDFAEQIGKPTSTIYTWLRNGNIPKECFTKIGKCIFVRIEPMKKFLNCELIE